MQLWKASSEVSEEDPFLHRDQNMRSSDDDQEKRNIRRLKKNVKKWNKMIKTILKKQKITPKHLKKKINILTQTFLLHQFLYIRKNHMSHSNRNSQFQMKEK